MRRVSAAGHLTKYQIDRAIFNSSESLIFEFNGSVGNEEWNLIGCSLLCNEPFLDKAFCDFFLIQHIMQKHCP